MKESTHNEAVRMWYGGASQRRIAKILRISRRTVGRLLARHEKARDGVPREDRKPRSSLLDRFEEKIAELVARYPHITAVRLHEELCRIGFSGGYTIVKDRLRDIRPESGKAPVIRFETGPAVQAQMDYSTYEIDFSSEGRRRVHAFSYILAYSRRQYVRFVESQDFTTTVREHIRAFAHLEGLAATCLYDNMKVVVTGYDGGDPIYNTRFLAFATHYGFKPRACRPHRPQTKGKIERPFDYLERNLLNARTFLSLDHLNETTAWWLANVADTRTHRETKQRPIDRYQKEQPYLLPLPTQQYDTSQVVYRTVNTEGYVSYRGNLYSVPWQRIGEFLPVRITEKELIIYGADIEEIARHELLGPDAAGEKRTNSKHLIGPDLRRRYELLSQRYKELGPEAVCFLEEIVRTKRCGKNEAHRILGLLAMYRRDDLAAALERARRYRAYSLSAVERILATQAEPRSTVEALQEEARDHLSDILRECPVLPRSGSEYQDLLENVSEPEGPEDEKTTEPDESA
jgi:transposase